jgi:hypothetical protein
MGRGKKAEDAKAVLFKRLYEVNPPYLKKRHRFCEGNVPLRIRKAANGATRRHR